MAAAAHHLVFPPVRLPQVLDPHSPRVPHIHLTARARATVVAVPQDSTVPPRQLPAILRQAHTVLVPAQALARVPLQVQYTANRRTPAGLRSQATLPRRTVTERLLLTLDTAGHRLSPGTAVLRRSLRMGFPPRSRVTVDLPRALLSVVVTPQDQPGEHMARDRRLRRGTKGVKMVVC